MFLFNQSTHCKGFWAHCKLSTTLALWGLDVVQAAPVMGSYLKIEAFKMKLRSIEKQLQAVCENTHPQCLTALIPTLNSCVFVPQLAFHRTSAQTHCQFNHVSCSMYTATSCWLLWWWILFSSLPAADSESLSPSLPWWVLHGRGQLTSLGSDCPRCCFRGLALCHGFLVVMC